MTRRLAAAVMESDTSALFVVPSTPATLEAAAGWIRDAQWRVVGMPQEFAPYHREAIELSSPAQLLVSLRSAAATEARRPVVVFTDQFVSAEHAPLFVRHGADERFFPSLEAIVAAQYGVAVSCWDGAGFARVARQSDHGTGVLRALHRYYQACDALGDAWLMRERQQQRTVAGRVETARLRLRLYQSIVMLAADDAASAAARGPMLEELMALQQKLPASAAA